MTPTSTLTLVILEDSHLADYSLVGKLPVGAVPEDILVRPVPEGDIPGEALLVEDIPGEALLVQDIPVRELPVVGKLLVVQLLHHTQEEQLQIEN